VFALPFAYLGMALAAAAPGWSKFIWITVGWSAARTLAMSANGLVDRELDAHNPRTMIVAPTRLISSQAFGLCRCSLACWSWPHGS